MSWITDIIDALKSGFKKINANPGLCKWLIAIGTFILIFFILSFDLLMRQNVLTKIKVGDISSREIISPAFVTYINEEEMKALQDEAMARVKPVYSIDENASEHNREALISANAWKTAENFIKEGILGENLKIDSGNIIVNGKEVPPAKLRDLKEVRDFLGKKGFSAPASRIQPTIKIDLLETQRLRVLEASMVEPRVVVLKKGQAIIRKGEEVGPIQMRRIKAFYESQGKIHTINLLGISMLLFGLFVVVYCYLYIYNKKVLEDNRLLLLLSTVTILTLLMARIISSLGTVSNYLIPVAFASITLAILLGSKLSLMFTFLLSLSVGIIANFDLGIALVAMGGGLVGIYGSTHVKQRIDLTRVGLYMAGINLLTISALGCVNSLSFNEIIKGALWGAGNAIVLSVPLVMVTLPYFEKFFSITTNFRLMELTDLNAGLLKELFLKATGTYHHSLLVGELAERAASEIGANSLLARVGGYYHDIGKMENPIYFMENQTMGVGSAHESISPKASSSIINSHIEEGVEIAKKHGLPQEVIDIICQHHGTTSKKSFFMTHLEGLGINNPGDAGTGQDQDLIQTMEDEFRYSGPKPQTKVAAIVMLADSAEAAVRASAQKGTEEIKERIRLIADNYLNDFQFEECNLTLRDIKKISESFVYVLGSVYHTRQEYETKNNGTGNNNGKK